MQLTAGDLAVLEGPEVMTSEKDGEYVEMVYLEGYRHPYSRERLEEGAELYRSGFSVHRASRAVALDDKALSKYLHATGDLPRAKDEVRLERAAALYKDRPNYKLAAKTAGVCARKLRDYLSSKKLLRQSAASKDYLKPKR